MDINVRKAIIQDCPSLIHLIKELATYEKAPDEVTVSLEEFELAGFGANPVWWGFVAEHQTAGIVGMTICYTYYSTWKGSGLYLEDFFVKEQYRKYGVGRKLFDAVIQEGKKQKLVLMKWQVLEWNKLALDFYDKQHASLDNQWINCSLPLS